MANINRDDLEGLAIALANAKQLENEAKEARVRAEEELANALGGADIGSTAAKCGRLGVTVKRGYNYKIATPKAFADQYPDFVDIKEKIELRGKIYEETRINNPDLFNAIAKFVTATPKKVSIELKV